ncbi:MAG: hypothetical protein AAFU73_00670 [Planctomycetota bacterium]
MANFHLSTGPPKGKPTPHADTLPNKRTSVEVGPVARPEVFDHKTVEDPEVPTADRSLLQDDIAAAGPTKHNF